MKKNLALVLLLFIAVQVFPQKKLSNNYDYKVSAPYRVFDAKNKYYFAKNNQAMALKFDGDDVIIQKFDTEKPAFVKDKKYEKLFPKNYWAESVLEMDNKYYFFYSSWDGDNKKEQLFSIEVDFEKGEFIGAPKLIIQIDGKIVGENGFGIGGVNVYGIVLGAKNKFYFIQSQDNKKLLVQYRKKPEFKDDKKSYDVIGLYSFDSDLNKKYSNEIKMPYTERRMNNLDYQLDNQGNLFLLTKFFHDDSNDDKKRKKDKVANYHVELFTIKSGTDKIEISKFENKDKFINKIWLFDTGKDFSVCAGFYSNGKGDFDDSDGIMAFKVKSDGKMYDYVYHEIPLEILNQYMSDRQKNKNEKKEENGEGVQFKDLTLKDLVVNTDGSIVLVGEQYFVQAHYNGGMYGAGNVTYTYHYNNILITKIDANGGLAWMKKIPKVQTGNGGQGGMSYKYFNANNNHYLVFLDNIKNIDLPLNKEPAKHSDGQGGYLTSVKIADADGAFVKWAILNTREV